jgi:hypothetical protein
LLASRPGVLTAEGDITDREWPLVVRECERVWKSLEGLSLALDPTDPTVTVEASRPPPVGGMVINVRRHIFPEPDANGDLLSDTPAFVYLGVIAVPDNVSLLTSFPPDPFDRTLGHEVGHTLLRGNDFDHAENDPMVPKTVDGVCKNLMTSMFPHPLCDSVDDPAITLLPHQVDLIRTSAKNKSSGPSWGCAAWAGSR